MAETNRQTYDILSRTAFIASAAAFIIGLALAFRSELSAAVMVRREE